MNRLCAFALLWISFAASVEAIGQTGGPAQTYPSKPVRVIVTFSPGGASDILARQIAPRLYEYFGQSFIVDNRGGAGGSIGAEIAAKAAPDGYTIIIVTGSYAANAAVYKPAFDPVAGIAPIVEVGFSPFIILANSSVSARSTRDLIAYARQNPGKLTYASSGTGGMTHLATAFFAHMAAIKLVHVPYKSSANGLTDLIGGQVQLMLGSMLPTLPHLKSGKIAGIAVTSAQRWPTTPDIPTVAETLPGYEAELWFGYWAPKGTPRAILDRLNAAINKAIREDSMKQSFATGGLVASGGTPQKFADRIRDDVARWTRVAAEAGIKPES